MQAIVGVALVLLFAASAAAQPTVTVRAESRLELDIRRADTGLLVTGGLRDDLGVPLAGDEVSLEVSHAIASEHQRGRHVLTRVVTADPEGRFTTTFAVDPGDYVVDATYEGASEHLGTRATRFFDLDRAHVTLRLALDGGTRIDLSVPEHALTIAAASESGGQALSMSVTDESGGAELAHGTTDADGVLHVTLASASLGPPAAGRIIVRTRGDATRAEAQSELPVVRLRPTQTTLALSRTSLGAGETIEATGTLSDGVEGLEREAVSLVSGDRVLTTVLTDEHGAFHATLDDEAFREVEGDVPVAARFDGSAPWIPGSESAAITITVSRPISLGWIWALVSIALAAIAVRWSLRRDARALPPPRRAEGVPGVALGARRTIVAQRMEVSGIARDAITGEPMQGALVRAGEHESRTGADGGFAFLASRDVSTLRIEHDEYLPLETPLALPHRGEHDGMQVRLASRRSVSFAALRHVAIELAPEGEVALALTQREIFEMLRARGASPPSLPDLVSRVELACYAAAPPSDDEIATIRRAATAITLHPTQRPRLPEVPAGRR